MLYKWFKGVAQATVPVYDEDVWKKDVIFNAPMGFIEVTDENGDIVNADIWNDTINKEVGNSYTSIRGLETVYAYAEGLCFWKTSDGKSGKAVSPACHGIMTYLKSCELTEREVDKNRIRPLLMAWLVECYTESTAKLDSSALSLTGRRIDDFLSRVGKDSAKTVVRKVGKMTSGNRETTTKAGASFMRELCRWTQEVTQMKYKTITQVVIK